MKARVRHSDHERRSDAEILAALARGKPDALLDLYSRYGRMMYSVMARHAPGLSHEDLEDLSQEVLLTVYHRARKYEHRGRLRAWLCIVAIGKARDWRRKERVRGLLAGRLRAEQAPTRVDPGDRTTTRLRLERALAQIPVGQREVMLLHEVNGLTGQEISEVLGIKPKTVWTRLHRARHALRRLLQEDS